MNFDWIVLASRDKQNLWVLSRILNISEKDIEDLIMRLKSHGFNMNKIIPVNHE